MFEQTFRNLDNVLRQEAGCGTELDYIEQTSWMLFLKYLDDLEHERALEAELLGNPDEIIAEIAALDAESAKILEGIRGML